MSQNRMLKHIRLQDGIFAPRQRTGHDVTIPECLKRCRETGRLKAFLLQWKEGDPDRPHIYWDSDVAKILEGMAEMLMIHPDCEMERQLDELVELVCSAQQPDGYLNTHFTVVCPEQRWSNLSTNHELYCAGHLIEAAVSHFEATGRRNFLNAVCRYADYIGTVFGTGSGQKKGYPGHEELELALVKLYRVTGQKKYLELASYFINQRGQSPNYFSEIEKTQPEDHLNQIQAHKPVREQTEAEGHAVRAVYLYSGMADVAQETGDTSLLDTCIRLFDNIVSRRMYITGGIGSTAFGEKFTNDFGLPNDTAYAESCAAVGLALFAKRLLDITGQSRYADVLERILYNNGLSGISLAGNTFFYTNRLEVNNTTLATSDHTRRERQKWFSCSCCPTTYCRFLPQLGRFCANAHPNRLRIDIPAAAVITMPEYKVQICGDYPYNGNITMTILKGNAFCLLFRIPEWCQNHTLQINGETIVPEIQKGYWMIQRYWHAGDKLEIQLEMPVQLIYAHPMVPSDAGRAAIMRGPLVYCLESVDNPNILLHTVEISPEPDFQLEKIPGLPPQTVGISYKGTTFRSDDGTLYRTTPPAVETAQFHAIPFALWQNRGPASMQVFQLAPSPAPQQ